MNKEHETSAEEKPKAKKISLKPLDFVCFFLSVAAIVFSFVAVRKTGGSAPSLVITTPSGQYVYELSKDGEYSVEGKIGISKIVVSGGKAYFTESPCPNKTCVQCAPISHNGEWIACMPNDVFVRIESKSESDVDAVAF